MFGKSKRSSLNRAPAVKAAHLALGERGETLALDYLKYNENYEIVATNFLIPLGRGLTGQKLTGEIDIIAYDGETLVFIEVKARSSDEFAAPERAVDVRRPCQRIYRKQTFETATG